MGFKEKMKKLIQKTAVFLDRQPHINSMKNGILVTVPATIIGGIMMIIATPPVTADMQPTNFFFQFMLAWKDWATTYNEALMIPYHLTLGVISVYAVAAIAYYMAKKRNVNELSATISAVMIFLMIAAPAKSYQDLGTMMSIAYLDGKGLFSAIIVGLLSVEVMNFLFKRNIKIRMPDSVPPMVTAPFEALIPLIVNIILFYGGSLILESTTGYALPALIIAMMKPLIYAADSLPGVLFMVFLINLFWIFGINGGAVVNSVASAFVLSNLSANAAAVEAGEAMQYINSGPFYNVFGNIGGFAATLGMVIMMLFVSKSSQLKSVSRIAIGPQLFNINEPVTYGMPLVMNPYLVVPILLVPSINVIIAYMCTSIGWIGKIYINAPWTLPGPLLAFASTLDWRAVVLWFVLLGVDMLLYLPFLKMYDRYLLNKEEGEELEEA